MAWTSTDFKRLRRDIGVTSAIVDDTEAKNYLDEAAEEYTRTAAAKAYARVIAIDGMLADAAKMTSYRQNASSENASDIYKQLRDLREIWMGRTDRANNQRNAIFEVY